MGLIASQGLPHKKQQRPAVGMTFRCSEADLAAVAALTNDGRVAATICSTMDVAMRGATNAVLSYALSALRRADERATEVEYGLVSGWRAGVLGCVCAGAALAAGAGVTCPFPPHARGDHRKWAMQASRPPTRQFPHRRRWCWWWWWWWSGGASGCRCPHASCPWGGDPCEPMVIDSPLPTLAAGHGLPPVLQLPGECLSVCVQICVHGKEWALANRVDPSGARGGLPNHHCARALGSDQRDRSRLWALLVQEVVVAHHRPWE